MRLSLLTSITVIMTLLFVSFEVQANPTPPKHQATLPLKGPQLPVFREHEFDAEVLNQGWDEIAHALRAVDLHVYSYPNTHTFEEEQSIQQGVLLKLKTAGFRINKVNWDSLLGKPGFYAQQGKVVIAAVWVNTTLYWGHNSPVTQQSKLDDGLIDAAYSGDVDAAIKFLAEGANPHVKDYNGDPVLKVASDSNRIAITKLLLEERKAKPSISYPNETLGALKVASCKNYPEIVQAIINDGVTPYQIGIAMKMAAFHGSANVIKVLLPVASQYDIDTNLATAVDAYFYWGSVIQYPDIVKLLVTRKPSQVALDKALLSAISVGQMAGIVPTLIAAGADVNARNEKGETAMICAVQNGWYTVVKPDILTLLKAGADPNLGDNGGTTPLMGAAVYDGPVTVKLLLTHGANPNIRNKAGHNAIYFIQLFQKSNPGKETRRRLTENQQLIENAIKQNDNH